MSAIKLHVIKPSVNNMSVRVFVRAAKLDFSEDDVYGKTRSPEFSAKNPSYLTPMVETDGLPKGVLWESCAIMQYLCNKHGLTSFYPTEPAARAMVDSAMFYVIGTLYPYVARATYPALGFPQYPGEVGASDAGAEAKAAAQKAAADAIAQPLNVLHSFYLSGKPFIGGVAPLHRRHTPGRDARVSGGYRLCAARMGQRLQGAHGVDVGLRLQRARRRRARLYRLGQVAEEVIPMSAEGRGFRGPSAHSARRAPGSLSLTPNGAREEPSRDDPGLLPGVRRRAMKSGLPLSYKIA